jgi:hypothetical protein
VASWSLAAASLSAKSASLAGTKRKPERDDDRQPGKPVLPACSTTTSSSGSISHRLCLLDSCPGGDISGLSLAG